MTLSDKNDRNTTFDRIYKIIQRIPKGKVATYRQIALLNGNPHGARTVGWALASLRDGSQVPWHRVINSRGTSSFPEETKRRLQQSLLEEEGVVFDQNGNVDLQRFQWRVKR